MERYTLEDIEMIRNKSGISYQEAVALLDYHNGNVARAMIDLEKNGRLKKESSNSHDHTDKDYPIRSRIGFGGKLIDLLRKLYYFRFVISKGNSVILNFSLLFCIACILFAPRISIAGIIISIIMGYRFSFNKKDEMFVSEDLKKFVKEAAQNARTSVVNAVQSFTGDKDSNRTEESSDHTMSDENVSCSTENNVNRTRSYFESHHSTSEGSENQSYRQVPTIQTPMKVESKEGNITVDNDSDGYHSAMIG